MPATPTINQEWLGEESYVDVYTFAPGTTYVEVHNYLVNMDAPDGYRCQHSYDCCGHFYPGKARISQTERGIFQIRQTWIQNF